MPTLQQRRLLLDQQAIQYLLLGRFSATIAAPLPSPLPLDIGSLTRVDTNGIMSQAGGVLVVSGTPAASDGLVSPSAYARLAGRALLFTIPTRTTIGTNTRYGWADAGLSDGDYTNGISYSGSGTSDVRARITSTLIDTMTVGAAAHCFACIMRGTGGFLLARNGITGPYTLLWGYSAGSSAQFAKQFFGASAMSYTLDDFRVLDLGGQWASDYGIATQRLAGARSAGDTFSHTADCLIEFTDTTIPSASNLDFSFRMQDASNYWQVTVDSTGALVLNEVVAGVPTSRGSSAAAVANGARIVVVAEASVIKVYVSNVSKISYSSASNFATATSGVLTALGTTGAVSDLIAWPRFVSLPNV